MSSACDKRLFAAVKRNDCEAVLTALREKANPNSVWLGWTPLMHAASNGHMEVTRLLVCTDDPCRGEFKGVDLGVHLDESSPGIGTALHLASEHNQPEIISLLIDAGADATVTDDEEATLLTRAAQFGNMAAAASVLEKLSPNILGLPPPFSGEIGPENSEYSDEGISASRVGARDHANMGGHEELAMLFDIWCDGFGFAAGPLLAESRSPKEETELQRKRLVLQRLAFCRCLLPSGGGPGVKVGLVENVVSRVQGAVLATVQLATNSLLGNLERQIMSRSMTSSMDAVMDSANLELALTTSSTDFEDMSCSPRMRAHFIASSPRGRATGVSGIASPRLRGSPRAPAGQAGLRGKLLRLQIDSPRPGSPRLLGILDDEEDMISSPVLRAQWEEHISKGTAPLLRSKDEQVLRSSGGSARSSQLSPARKPTPTERVVVAEAWNECFSPEAGRRKEKASTSPENELKAAFNASPTPTR